MGIKNKRKRTYLRKILFLAVVFAVSMGIQVQAAENETRTVILETEQNNMVEVRTVDKTGMVSQDTIINEEDASTAKEKIEKPLSEKEYAEESAWNVESQKILEIPQDNENDIAACGTDFTKGAAQGTEVTIYVLDEDYRQYISIPNGYPQSYSLSGHTYGKVNGSSITISGGSIIPAVETWYYHQEPDSGYWIGQTQPSGQEGEIVKQRYIYKDSTIVIDGKTVTFHISEYATVYSKQIMDKYLNENIHSGMTDYEKAESCCKFVAGYDYGTDSTSYTGLIVTGSGDCWASTNTLLYMFDKLGIKAQSRSASQNPGAGSGHYNVLAILDGYYYIVDAGYSGKAPRTYSLRRFSSSNLPYIYSVISELEKTICITDYYDFGEKEINIPSEIDGYTVTQIGDKAFYSTGMAEKIVIPNTVLSIRNSAFANCYQLKTIEIPNSVVSLGKAVFYHNSKLESIRIPASVNELTGGMVQSCYSLKEIIVDEENASYCSKDGVLFDKSMKTLISYPPGKSDAVYHVPEGVTAISDWAFVSCGEYVTEDSSIINNGFQKLVLPKSLRTIGEFAFRYMKIEELQIQHGITAIPSYSFQSATISKVTLPDSVTEIEPYAFYRADMKEIVLSNTLTSIGEAAFAGNLKMKTMLPKTVQSIGYGAFWLDYGWSSMETSEDGGFNNYYNGYVVCNDINPEMEERAFYGQVSLGVLQNSSMHSYAAENGIYYVYVDSSLKCTLKKEWFYLAYPYFIEVGNLKTNYRGTQEDMTAAPYLMVLGKDVTLEYDGSNGIVYVTGIGYMTGTISIAVKGFPSGSSGTVNTGQTVEPAIRPASKKLSASCTNKGIKLEWDAVKGSTGYQIYRSAASKNIYSEIANIKNSKSTSYIDPNVKKGETYDYYICFSGITSNIGYSLDKPILCTVNPEKQQVKKPSKVKVKSVKANGKKKLKITWKKAANVAGYQVQYAGNRKFTKTKKSKSISSASTKIILSKLKTRKTYYIRIRAYRKSGSKKIYGNWSSIKQGKAG